MDVRVFDQQPHIQPLVDRYSHRAAYRLLGRRPISAWKLNARLLECAEAYRPDVVLVTKGAYVFPRTLRRLRRLGAKLANYATDDPFNPRVSDGWLHESIPEYDLYACTKRAIVDDVLAAGCPRAAFVMFAYDPGMHFAESAASESELEPFRADVAFVGAADQDRFDYLDALLDIPNLKIALYGSYWQRQPARFRRIARNAVYGRDYRLALTGTKVALGLLRAANRDRHAMRSFEIPACGTFFCAPRTDEHMDILKDGEEAAFFDSPEDLRAQVVRYLGDEEARQAISAAGARAVLNGPHTYADRVKEIVELTLAGGSARQ